MQTHTDVMGHSALGPNAWFVLAIPATIAYGLAGVAIASLLSATVAGAVVVLALVVATAWFAHRSASESVVAYLGGTVATAASVFAVMAIAIEFSL